ncbi:hypothetical protein ARMGADRAFT_1028514 [Armillaria gallica]|uniref:Uncharacterized protein n=1 Tax=Armillaria gallica TaxID=47427 RepID=A0A2H3DW89_ARMGA|nr:hypothetical protein ARMGADRAFT_1028514 [Armillaria gallica]
MVKLKLVTRCDREKATYSIKIALGISESGWNLNLTAIQNVSIALISSAVRITKDRASSCISIDISLPTPNMKITNGSEWTNDNYSPSKYISIHCGSSRKVKDYHATLHWSVYLNTSDIQRSGPNDIVATQQGLSSLRKPSISPHLWPSFLPEPYSFRCRLRFVHSFVCVGVAVLKIGCQWLELLDRPNSKPHYLRQVYPRGRSPLAEFRHSNGCTLIRRQCIMAKAVLLAPRYYLALSPAIGAPSVLLMAGKNRNFAEQLKTDKDSPSKCIYVHDGQPWKLVDKNGGPTTHQIGGRGVYLNPSYIQKLVLNETGSYLYGPHRIPTQGAKVPATSRNQINERRNRDKREGA